MKETYVALGVGMSWAVAVFGVAAMLLASLIVKRNGKRSKPSPMMILLAAGYGIFGLLELPFEWFPPLMFVLVGIGTLFPAPGWPEQARRSRVRFAVGSVALGVVAFFALPAVFSHLRMTLTDDSVSWTEFGRGGTVPRNGLRVHATGRQRGWWETRNWFSWTSYSGHELGPGIHGGMLFYGPHGFVRGDRVGERLAEWAGTKPKVRIRTGDD